MEERLALLLTDVVDSAALAERLGDAAMAALWTAHDRLARDLLRDWRGREIDKTDGFLLSFGSAADALGYAQAYHRALARLASPIRARAGLHVGMVSVRETPAADVALGAKPIELDGLAKPVAARVMATAAGGQTLLTAAACEALGTSAHRVVSHGHWRIKGLPEPLELFEAGDADAPFTPPPDAEKAYRVLRQGELWLPAREVRHSLPAERDDFVGRRATLLDLARRFDDGARLVSLLGIGGCGKTRLAAHFGWAWLGDYPGGAWFCDLAASRSMDGLVGAVAQGLDVPLGKGDPVMQLGHAIAGRGECLVILDNFEQVARHAEATVGRWLERAGQARFLVTTREVLGIAGEEALALAPMESGEAMALFLRRAAAAKRDFQPTAEDQAAVEPLVRLLDGLPLAIELAAARVRTLPPRALLARMSERFRLLASSGSRIDRQATLRATFDWSWDLLVAADKAALAQLSVFEGGFTLEAAEAVIDLSQLADPPWVVDVVNSLVDKSFVRPLGGERFDLLVSVQAYAGEHLQTEGRWAGSGPAALKVAQTRHGGWFAALGPVLALQARCADLDNLVAACRRALAQGDGETAVGALEGAWAALARRGPVKAGLDLAEAVCALPGLAVSLDARARWVFAGALIAAGMPADARSQNDRALAGAVAAGDRRCEAKANTRRGVLLGLEGRNPEAEAAQQAGLQLARAARAHDLEVAALCALGNLAYQQGRADASKSLYETALALARSIGDRHWQGSLLGNLANVDTDLGLMDASRVRSEEALALARELGDRQLEGNTLCNLGMLHFVQGRLDEACTVCEAALVGARELGHVRLECIVLCNLALVYDAWGRLTQARGCYESALDLARRLGDRRDEGQFLGYLGLSHARQGNLVAARSCLGSGQAILRELSDPVGLGVLLCSAAECEWRAGDPASAQTARDEAAALAQQVGAGAASELGQGLARLDALLASPRP